MEQNVLYYLKKLLIYKNAFGFCEFYLDIVFYLFLPKQYSNNSYMAVPDLKNDQQKLWFTWVDLKNDQQKLWFTWVDLKNNQQKLWFTWVI